MVHFLSGPFGPDKDMKVKRPRRKAIIPFLMTVFDLHHLPIYQVRKFQDGAGF
ncbi:hypothetical protein KCP73_03030 [Salmonella enterica subsp. enterica]|nr:hypothetical protein KCP73_03030 [Salmonella enterica subsp. enterica]